MVEKVGQATCTAEGRVVWAALRQAHLLVKGAMVATGAPVEACFF
jgi:hypothetical protein